MSVSNNSAKVRNFTDITFFFSEYFCRKAMFSDIEVTQLLTYSLRTFVFSILLYSCIIQFIYIIIYINLILNIT